ncbi:hypothetical protein, partial [Chamaesiphon sp.]|uniref:hypothetical protein n=1 Tax=Chamaesiphon sp. TaxID=2814140 RepID=UPI003593FED8
MPNRPSGKVGIEPSASEAPVKSSEFRPRQSRQLAMSIDNLPNRSHRPDRFPRLCATIMNEDYFRLYGSFYKLFSESNSLHLQDSGDSDMSIYVGNLSYE